MGKISTGLGRSQEVSAEASDFYALMGSGQGTLIALPANVDNRTVRVVSPRAFKGEYVVSTDDLPASPVNMMAPQIVQDPQNGMLSVALPGLWAHDELGIPPVFTYRWRRNGENIAGATGRQYMPVAADAGQSLLVAEAVMDASGTGKEISNAVEVDAVPNASATGLGRSQEVSADASDFYALMGSGQGTLIALPANVDSRTVRVVSPSAFKGEYVVSTDDLPASPVNMMAPQIVQDPQNGMLSVALPGLWAHDELGIPPVFTYRWRRNGKNIAGATGRQYMPVAADAGQSLLVAEAVMDANGTGKEISNAVEVDAVPDTFSVALDSDGTLQITGNDGRNFTLVDPADNHSGTYAVDPAALAAGPVGLSAPQLLIPTSTDVGATLAITPALFAYDPAQGGVTIRYTSTGTNAVDVTNQNAPTLLIDVDDASTTIRVTARVTQDGVHVSQRSNTVEIADYVDLFDVMLGDDNTLQIIGNDGRTFDVNGFADLYDGTYNVGSNALDAGPVALVASRLVGTGEAGATLAVTPALFAYDPASGAVTIRYSTNATNAVDATNPDAPTLLVDAADAGMTCTVTAIATQGTDTSNSVSNGVSILGTGASIRVEAVGLLGSSNRSADPSFTLDLSNADVGDKIVLVYGTNAEAEPSMTLGGVTVGASLANTGDAAFSAKTWIFEHTMTEAGRAATDVELALDATRVAHMLTAVLVKGAAHNASSADFQFGIGGTPVSVTPANTANVVIAVAMGHRSFFGTHTWTNAAQTGALFSDTQTNRASTVAIANNVAAAPYTVSFNPDPDGTSNDDVALAVVSYS